MFLVLRDQKTTRNVGTYQCPVRSPVYELMALWLRDLRPRALGTSPNLHDYVFFNVKNGNPWEQQPFSKFWQSSAREITGHDLNLQTMRRIFIEGISVVKAHGAFLPAADFLEVHSSPVEWTWLATALLTGEDSIRRVYFRDGLQKQAFKKVTLSCLFQLSSPWKGV